ncbi:hypothetical protein WICPIJ_004487 [Wickerhamomyces pijperi]|uniref:Cytochrome c oxidase assembly protein COX14 n=1 Tax=Wickerhamomyces pijperi TaxID=599730 RepID=A0A9P8Q7N7_WICPI|nr:hypothetical protein WICPIJ_004487 [Wickerhamomyces pijperi]
MAGGYPWYTRVADAAHRLTVLSLVGGSLYIIGGLSYQIYLNGKNFEKEQKLLAAQQQQQQFTEESK